MKENEQAFRNTMSPAFRKYGLRDKSRDKLDSLDTYAKDLTPDKIERLAKGWVINTMNKLQQDGKNILYTVAAVVVEQTKEGFLRYPNAQIYFL